MIAGFARVARFVLGLALTATPLGAQAVPTFQWSPGPPLVTGVSPGGGVVFLGITREPRGDSQRVTVVREVVRAAAAESSVAVPWSRGEVPARSVWAAVDESSGVFALSSPSAELVPDSPVSFLPAGGGALTVADGWLEVLLVRPGGGLWGGTVRDGALGDQDGAADGAIQLDPGSLSPLEDAPALVAWASGDVLITIDLDTLAASSYRVGGAP